MHVHCVSPAVGDPSCVVHLLDTGGGQHGTFSGGYIVGVPQATVEQMHGLTPSIEPFTHALNRPAQQTPESSSATLFVSCVHGPVTAGAASATPPSVMPASTGVGLVVLLHA